MNSNSHTLTRGNKQFELCNHLGNVLVTVQDRKRSVDVNADNQADYYLPYLRTVTNYYAYGSAMPGIGGSIKECTVTSTNLTLKKYPYFYTFSNDSTSGFTAGSGARSVTNPTHNVLHLESIWTTRPLANKSIYLKNGVNYALKFNLAGFSVVSGYTHTVKIRILLPGNTLSYTYTATGNQTINFTSNTTGNVTVEISSQITGSGTYGVNPYIDIDNFNLSWDSAYTAYVNTCSSYIESYRYLFNGKENDLESGLQDYGFRIYNPSLGKFLSVDPLSKDYPWYTPYQFAGNIPIWAVDLDGLEPKGATKNYKFIRSKPLNSNSKFKLKLIKDADLKYYWILTHSYSAVKSHGGLSIGFIATDYYWYNSKTETYDLYINGTEPSSWQKTMYKISDNLANATLYGAICGVSSCYGGFIGTTFGGATVKASTSAIIQIAVTKKLDVVDAIGDGILPLGVNVGVSSAIDANFKIIKNKEGENELKFDFDIAGTDSKSWNAVYQNYINSYCWGQAPNLLPNNAIADAFGQFKIPTKEALKSGQKALNNTIDALEEFIKVPFSIGEKGVGEIMERNNNSENEKK